MVFDAVRAYNLVPEEVGLYHVPFGLVLGEDGKKIKTRSGESVRLKELLDEAVSNAQANMEERIQNRTKSTPQDPSSTSTTTAGDEEAVAVVSSEFKEIAAKVGLAAVKYADLSMNRLSDYRFSFDKMLSLTGNTAPYMLYAYVRIRGIQRKAEEASTLNHTPTTTPPSTPTSTTTSASTATALITSPEQLHLSTPEELALAKQLLRLEEILLEVSYDYCPNKVLYCIPVRLLYHTCIYYQSQLLCILRLIYTILYYILYYYP